MDIEIYPTISMTEEGAAIPNVYLPRDLSKRIPKFYENNGKRTMEEYASKIKKGSEHSTDIRFTWDEKLGLYYLSLSTNIGLELITKGIPHFQTQNLEGIGYAFIAFSILTRYAKEIYSINPNSKN